MMDHTAALPNRQGVTDPRMRAGQGARRAAAPRARASRSWKSRLGGPVGMPVMVFVVTSLLILLHQGKLLEICFLPMSGIVAIYLYRRYPAHYLGFVCWLCFLAPEVRRFADFFNGAFNPKSPIMVAPVFATVLSGLALFSHYKTLGQRAAVPLLLVSMGLFYAYMVGLAVAGVAAATYTLAAWMSPVLVGLRVLVTWREYPTYERVLLKTFIYGSLIMGAYGVYEFISPPPWDAFWLIQSGMHSEGEPVPFSLRVSSTMNSSGPFAIGMMTGLLMLLAGQGKARIAAAVVGVPSLLFTSVRASWGGLAIGLIYPLAMLDGRSRVRLLIGVVAFVGICMPLTLFDEISAPLLKRMETVQNITKDNSYNVRASFYRDFLTKSLTNIAGEGLGTTGLGTKLADDPSSLHGVVFDSGVMEVPFVMGWPGTLLYVGGILMMLWRALVASLKLKNDRFAISGVGVSLAILCMMVFVNTLTTVSGMFFFIGVTLPVIGLRYRRAMLWVARKNKAAQAKQAPTQVVTP